MREDKPGRLGRSPTIQDVARLAGVSVATVSAVINANVRVSPKRTEMVRAAMAALHYQPDERGRVLRTGRSRTIGVVVPDVTNPFYPEILRDFEHAARAKGYSVLLCDSENSVEQERANLAQLAARRVDGALVACVSSRATYDWLENLALPLVFFERIPLAGRFSAVSTDHRAAALQATRHFLELGHHRVAFFLGDPTLSSNFARVEGFRQAMSGEVLPVRDNLVVSGLFSAEDAIRAATLLLCQPDRPTAVLCSNSVLLLGVARAARDHGLRCPDDLSLICFDNPSWTAHYPPPITTMAQPTAEIAEAAIGMILGQIGAEPKEDIRWLSDRLIVRRSTGPAPSSSHL
jgi:LacI family transcriptional regulator